MTKNKEILKTVVDEESGKKIALTQEMITEYAAAIVQYRDGLHETDQGIFDLIVSVGRMIDKKLYLAAGYTNVEKFAAEVLGMSRAQAYNMYNVYKKVPLQVVQRVGHSNLPSFRRLLALPGGESFWENLEKSDLKELKVMSDEEFGVASGEAKKDDKGWQARYMKKYRALQLAEERIKTEQAEKEAERAAHDETKRELSVAKSSEKDPKNLKLQQALDNMGVKYTEAMEKLADHEAEEMTMQQAKAVINRAFDLILEALFSLKKIKMCAALTPQLYGSYEMAKAMIDAEISYIVEHTDVTGGPFTIQDLAGEVEIHSLGGDIMQLEDETDEEYQQRYRALMKSFPRGGRKILSHRHPSGKKQPLFSPDDPGAKKEDDPDAPGDTKEAEPE